MTGLVILQRERERERERERDRQRQRQRQRQKRQYFICKAGTPEGQLPIYTGAYVTVHNNAHIEKKAKTNNLYIDTESNSNSISGSSYKQQPARTNILKNY